MASTRSDKIEIIEKITKNGKTSELHGLVDVIEDLFKEQELKKERKKNKKESEFTHLELLGGLAKRSFKKTKLGKVLTSTTDFINNKKDSIQNKIDNSKDKLFLGAARIISSIGHSNNIVDIINNETNNTDIIDEITSKETIERVDKEKQKLNLKTSGDTSIIEKTNESITNINNNLDADNKEVTSLIDDKHYDLKKDINKIYDEIYDFTHKQDTSITKKPDKTLCGVANINKKEKKKEEEEEETSGFFDFFNNKTKKTKTKGTTKGNKKGTKLKTKVKPKTRFGKALDKVVSKPKNIINNSIKSVKNTKTVSSIIKAGSKATKIGSSVMKGASKAIPLIGTGLALGLGAYDYATADDDRGRKDAFGSTLGGMGGAYGGAAIGATIGSVIPVVGTIIGGVLGAGVGAFLGSEAGSWVMDTFFSDIDDTISDEDKESPFTFAEALKVKKYQLLTVAQSPQATEDQKEKAIKGIKEADKRIKEVTSRSELKDFMEEQIDITKDKEPDFSEEIIAKKLIGAAPPEFQEEMVDIYNSDIVGGWFHSDGNLKLTDIVSKSKQEKNDIEQNGNTVSLRKQISETTTEGDTKVENSIVVLVGEGGTYVSPPTSPTSHTPSHKKDSTKKQKNITTSTMVNKKPIMGDVDSTTDYNIMNASGVSNVYSDFTANNVNFSNKNKNVKITNTADNQINTKSMVDDYTAKAENVVQSSTPIIINNSETSEKSTPTASVSINSFSSRNEDVIASEMIGGM